MGTLIELPTAGGKSVEQERRPGRLPKSVPSLPRERSRRRIDSAIAQVERRRAELGPYRAEILSKLEGALMAVHVANKLLDEVTTLVTAEAEE